MCGIAGIVWLGGESFRSLDRALAVQTSLIAHRGPDGEGIWISPDESVGLAHRRLAIIDLGEAAAQPMHGPNGTVITYNGEIYNYLELREALADRLAIPLRSRTPNAYLPPMKRYGARLPVDHLRGMFAFALWDERRQRLFCGARSLRHQAILLRRGDGNLLLRLGGQGAAAVPAGYRHRFRRARRISDLPVHDRRRNAVQRHQAVAAGHMLSWWRTASFGSGAIGMCATRSTTTTARLISSAGCASCSTKRVAGASAQRRAGRRLCLGRHRFEPDGDPRRQGRPAESRWVSTAASPNIRATTKASTPRLAVDRPAAELHIRRHHRAAISAITSHDVIYHLDFPVAGPGSFPQFMVSELAAKHSRWCSAARAATRSSAAMRAICSPISSNASRRRSTAPTRTAITSSRSSRSCPISACCANTSR